MQLRTCLALTLGGLLLSVLIIGGVGWIATSDLANRVKTVDQAAALARHLGEIERSRRLYHASHEPDDLARTRTLVRKAQAEIDKLGLENEDAQTPITLFNNLQQSFERYEAFLDAYASNQSRKADAAKTMAAQLASMKSMAEELKETAEADYHRAFAASTSIREAEELLKTTLRLTALANDLIVKHISIERAVDLLNVGGKPSVLDISLAVGRIAEIADRIRHIETTAPDGVGDARDASLPDTLALRSNQFQIGFDSFRLAAREQRSRSHDMDTVALTVTQLIEEINANQAQLAVEGSNTTKAVSLSGVAVSLVIGLLAIIVVRSRIIVPISSLTGAMQRMSTGDLSGTVPGIGRNDELGAMAEALEVFRKTSLEARHLATEKIEVERRLATEKTEAAVLEASLETERELGAQQRRFLSLVSHEFRTPLAIIDGRAQRLIRKGDKIPADTREADYGKIRDAVRRLTDLMESVLSSASLEAGKIECAQDAMDLRTLIESVCSSQQEISQNHTIDVSLEALPDQFVGDQKLLRQVFTNLLSNAVKYSPRADKVCVTAATTADSVIIAVRDFGVGIPEKEVPKLFQRFFRASTSSGIQGTGIGLNLVKSLVEMHDGEIQFSSKEGEGSTFTVILPCSSEDLVGAKQVQNDRTLNAISETAAVA